VLLFVAAAFATDGCVMGQPAACRELGRQTLATNLGAGRLQLRRACDLGDALACEWFAESWEPEDPERAEVGYRRACLGGRREACVREAVVSVDTRPAEAFDQLRSLCQSEEVAAMACVYAASLATGSRGEGLKDLLQARQYALRACRLGSFEGCGVAKELAAGESRR
jgi:TPR repeat protein